MKVPVRGGRGQDDPPGRERMAEGDFPIAEVSKHAAREKGIRRGHTRKLHLR